MLTSKQEIINVLKTGGIVALPTDTVIGLAIDPQNKMAKQKLYRLKNRSDQKPLVYMLAEPKQLEQLEIIIDQQTQNIIDKHWPGALTVIFKKKYSAETIGVRIPAQKELLDILKAWNKPLGVTSANLSGEKEINDMSELAKQFGPKIDYYYAGKAVSSGVASTVIDVSSGTIKVLRQGEIKL